MRTAIAMVGLFVLAAACTSDGTLSRPADTSTGRLPEAIQKVIDQPRFDPAVWGIDVVNLDTGQVLIDHGSQRALLPGSTPKIFSTAAALETFGPDHTFVTPVYAVGHRTGSTLTGSLVLVASGDLVMGGRARPDGTVDFTTGDHNDANSLPFGSLTPEDPLAGLAHLAQQVAASGITHVDGDVLIDDRLFQTNDHFAAGLVSPIVVNDNLVDVTITPGREGETATVDWRPRSPAYTVTSQVLTVGAGQDTDVTIVANDDGSMLTATGQIAVDADPLLRVHEVSDPAAFARTLFIEELRKAGVDVTAAAVGPNPAAQLPPADQYRDQVASYESPPLSEITKLILKVSYNRGADLLTCLLATTVGSTDCADGMPVEGAFIRQAGVPDHSYALFDGAGANERNRVSAVAATSMLDYIHHQPYGELFKESLPVLGKSGSLARTTVKGPAIGHVYAKTGTGAWGFPDGQDGVFVGTKALAGYIDAESGAHLAFGVYLNNAVVDDVNDMLAVGVDEIAAALYAEY